MCKDAFKTWKCWYSYGCMYSDKYKSTRYPVLMREVEPYVGWVYLLAYKLGDGKYNAIRLVKAKNLPET